MPELVFDGLAPVAKHACAHAMACCDAAGAAILLEGSGFLALCLGENQDTDAQLGRDLAGFARHCAQEDAQATQARVIDGADGAFFAVPVGQGRRRIGILAVAVQTPASAMRDMRARLDNLAALIGMILASAMVNRQLEVDLSDVTNNAKTLKKIADSDPLTGLANKSAFEARCKARLTNDTRPAALLALDLDDFKRVNDVYGHLFGDVYLKTIAETLRSELPNQSIIGRIGGDEFCALVEMPENGEPYIQSVIRHLRLGLRKRAAVLGKPELGGMSIGVSLFPQQARGFDDLWRHADCALYAAKRTDGQASRVYSAELEGLMEPSGHMDGKNGFNIEELTTYFQPVFAVANAACSGVEVLARWRDKTGVLQPPDRFSWIFRDHRFTAELTPHIVATALEQLCLTAAIPAQELPDLWINVTDNDLVNPDFIFEIQSMLTQFKVPWSKLIFEVNEDCMLDRGSDFVPSALHELRQRGARIALDDFGAGRTGLVHLCEWPIDIIKIDRRIIQKQSHDKGAKAVFDALVLVARQMGLVIAAEGVETPAQMAEVRQRGSALAQGFGLAKPMSAEDLQRTGFLPAVGLGVT